MYETQTYVSNEIAPKYFVEQYEISLATLGLALLLLRSIDFFQDPLLGRLASSTVSRGSFPLWIATNYSSLCVPVEGAGHGQLVLPGTSEQ